MTIIAFLFLALSFLFMLVICVLSPVLWVNYNTAIAQNSLNAAIITFDSLTLRDPTANSLTVDADVTISQAGKFSATMKSTTVNVLYKGNVFGTMTMPERDLEGSNEPTRFQQTSTLVITNNTVFQNAAKILLNGETVLWRLSGDVTLTVKMGFSLDFSLHIEKDVQLIGKKLQNALAYDVTVISGTVDTLYVKQNQSFTNPSNIALDNMGTLQFNVLAPNPAYSKSVRRSRKRRVADSSNDEYINIGVLTVPQFKALIGENRLTNCTVAATKTSANTAALESFLSGWFNGIDQPIKVLGPISSSTNSTFLYNIVEIEGIVQANTITAFVNATWNTNDTTVLQYSYNPIDVDVIQTSANFDVHIEDSGVKRPGFFVAYTLYGSNYCVSRPKLGGVSLSNDQVKIPAKGYAPVLLTVGSGFNYCDGYRLIGLCCALGPNSNTTMMLGVSGVMTTTVEKFSFNQAYHQGGIPFVCGPNAGYGMFCNDDFVSNPCIQLPDQYCDNLLAPKGNSS